MDIADVRGDVRCLLPETSNDNDGNDRIHKNDESTQS